MRIPGVIGGLGPQTTADYYLRIQELAQKYGFDARPPMLTWSVPLPYSLEEQAISKGVGFEEIAEYLVDGAQRLEKAGADFIVMPCNTLHLLSGQIRDSVKIPFISIIDETVNVVLDRGVKKLALLSTGATAGQGLYSVPFGEHGIEVIKPRDEQQEELDQMVVRLINGRESKTDKTEFQNILNYLKKQGAEVALLACTDFHLLCDQDSDLKTIDTMEVLAQATMRQIVR